MTDRRRAAIDPRPGLPMADACARRLPFRIFRAKGVPASEANEEGSTDSVVPREELVQARRRPGRQRARREALSDRSANALLSTSRPMRLGHSRLHSAPFAGAFLIDCSFFSACWPPCKTYHFLASSIPAAGKDFITVSNRFQSVRRIAASRRRGRVKTTATLSSSATAHSHFPVWWRAAPGSTGGDDNEVFDKRTALVTFTPVNTELERTGSFN